jgi:phosphoserine phosphatase
MWTFFPGRQYVQKKQTFVFDMDSTLIQTEVIDELADRAGVGAAGERSRNRP